MRWNTRKRVELMRRGGNDEVKQKKKSGVDAEDENDDDT